MKKFTLLMLCMLLVLTGCNKTADKKSSGPDYSIASTEEILEDMTLEEKVAQMFIVSCPTVDAAIYASQYQFGGYIYFYNHFKDSDPDTFRKNLQNYQDNVKIPMFMAVDEEGGEVVRASLYPQFRKEPFSSPRSIYEQGGMEAIRKDTKEKSEFLLDLGLNINFGPVCDIVEHNTEVFMYKRCVGLDAKGTSEYTKAVIEEMNNCRIGSVLKHFPGYGENDDTHITEAYDSRDLESFRQKDFLPFKAGIDAGANMVMVSHNIVDCMEKGVPASLSPKVHEILRNELGFKGIIITDDMSMGALIPKEYENDSEKKEELAKNQAVEAVLAGNDMICLASDNFTPILSAVTDAVKDGTISEKQIDESVARIIEYKRQLGLFR